MTKSLTTKPLAVYARVSDRKDREDKSYHSPQEQEERARAHAESRGYTTDGFFYDESVSGGVHPEERPEMHRLLEAVRAGEVGGICAGWLDRLSREPSHGEWLVKEVLKHGGVVIAPDIPQDITSASGRMTFRMLLDVAAFIRDTARERFTISKIGSIRSGVPVSQAPVGYRRICDGSGEVDRKDRRLELDTETAPVVEEMFKLRAQGVGRGQLHKLLVERTRHKWAREAVRVILANPIYKTGRLRYQLNKQDATSWIESEWAATPVVSEALWEAAQKEPLPQAAALEESRQPVAPHRLRQVRAMRLQPQAPPAGHSEEERAVQVHGLRPRRQGAGVSAQASRPGSWTSWSGGSISRNSPSASQARSSGRLRQPSKRRESATTRSTSRRPRTHTATTGSRSSSAAAWRTRQRWPS